MTVLSYLYEVGRGLTRVLNALCGGEGDTTFSAESYQLHLEGSAWGDLRVRVVNWINHDPDHCADAWLWHMQHGLLNHDD